MFHIYFGHKYIFVAFMLWKEMVNILLLTFLELSHLLPHYSTLPCPGYSMWNPWKGGWTAEIPWNGGMDSMEWGMDSMIWGMDSILLVDGFHGMGDGFHTFSRGIPYFF